MHKEIIKKDIKFYLEALELARKVGMKDQVIIGLLLLSKTNDKEVFQKVSELLKTFPPNQIAKKFIEMKRKTKLFSGIGSKERRLLKEYLDYYLSKEYYLIKYRRYLRDLVNIAHYKNAPQLLFTPLTRYKNPSPYLQGIIEFLKTKDPKKLPDGYPFEILRSNLKREKWGKYVLKSDLTPNSLILQACSLYAAYPKIVDEMDKILEGKYITSDKILKACVMAHLKEMHKLRDKLAKIYTKKVSETYKDLILPIEEPKILVLLDGSSSMEPKSIRGMFFKSLSTIAPFSPLIKKLIVFSDHATQENPELLKTFEGLLELIRLAPDEGTNLQEALTLALEDEECDTIIIVTDEQANLVSGALTEFELIKKLLDKGKIVILINPTPYPVSVTNVKDKRIIYVKAPNPESVIASLKLAQLRKTKVGAKKLVVQIKEKVKEEELDYR